jgi:flagellin
MASVINTNMASLYAQKNLSGAQNALSTSVERLSSGLRINRAKDDAAGLGISEKIKSQVTSLNQGLRNANDAISVVQTAEGSLSEVSSILQRMKELSVQARNDSLSTTQRSFISDELVALKNEINSIAERTTFNDLSLLKNAMRTQVSVPALADATRVTNGASLLSGVSVSGLSVNNTNVGTYTLTTGTVANIDGQLSEAAGKFGGSEIDVITLSDPGVDLVHTNSTITATIAITGGATITASYTLAANDFTANGDGDGASLAWGTDEVLGNVAKKLAAEINVQAQAATGVPIAARADGASIYIGGDSDTVALTTSVAVSGTGDSGAAAVATSQVIENAARTITISESDGVEGNKFTVAIGGKEYSVVAGYGASASAIATEVASQLEQLIDNDYPGASAASGVITLPSAAGVGVADISLSVKRLSDGDLVTNTLSSVSAPDLDTAGTARYLTINDFDVVEGRKVTVKVGNPEIFTEYSTIVGAGDSAADVATRLNTLLDQNFSNTLSGSQITFPTGDALGMSVIEVEFRDMVDGATVDAASYVSAKNMSRADRTITINQSDLTPGNVVSVNIGNKEYAVKVEASDQAADVAYKLSTLIDNDYGGAVISSGDAAAAVDFNAVGMKRGDSIAIEGLTFTASKDISASQVAAAFVGLTNPDSDGVAAAKEYGFYTGKITGFTSTLTDSDTVTFSAAVDVSARRSVSVGASGSSHVITLGAGLELGLEDISVTVKTITDPGKLTLTANADTGIGGTAQTIDVGTIAAGSAKTFDFDRLGVSFTLNNANATAVNADSFEAFTPAANTLVVESAMNGEALFQVGAGTRDNVVIDGFKDIRITGYNNNAGSEKLVFDNINTTLNTIAQNTTESLSEANFATLENQIEAAITTISDFRSYLGAQQNRIEFAISNIQAQSENLTAANSRIVDTDYAAETANLTKTQIMQQAATAMLAQANQMPNVILALLK